MDELVDIKKSVDLYLWQVQDVEKAIAKLSKDADELAEAIRVQSEHRKAARTDLEALTRRKASLLSELDSLRAEFGNAQLDGNVAEEQRVKKRKREIDSELSEVEENVLEASRVEGDEQAAELDARAAELAIIREEIEGRLPQQYYHTNTNLHPMLEAIEKTMRHDADRLRKMFLAVKPPTASDAALEKARQRKGVKGQSEPAWLIRREARRKERMKRFGNVSGNTGAVGDAMKRTYREPEPRPTVTSQHNDSGVLPGSEIARILREKQETKTA